MCKKVYVIWWILTTGSVYPDWQHILNWQHFNDRMSKWQKLKQMGNFEVSSYGDIGGEAYGKVGRYTAETMVIICQCGGCVAYMVFIAQNLSSIFTGSIDKFPLIIYLLIPIEIALSWIRSLSSLAPRSILADACNVWPWPWSSRLIFRALEDGMKSWLSLIGRYEWKYTN